MKHLWGNLSFSSSRRTEGHGTGRRRSPKPRSNTEHVHRSVQLDDAPATAECFPKAQRDEVH